MINKKLDRRSKYSQMVIKESFLSILDKKPLSKITVTEICQAADINRATFYAYYNDTYDLLDKIELEFIEMVKVHLENSPMSPGSYDCMLRIFLDYVYNNAKLCKVLLEKNIENNFEQRAAALMEEIVVNNWLETQTVSSQLASYAYHYHANGCIAIIRKWLYEGLKESPEEIMNITFEIMELSPQKSN